LIARHTPSVEIALQHFRTLDVIWNSDIVAVFFVEGQLILGGTAIPSEVPVCRNIRKYLGSDTGPDMSLVRGGRMR
jgi:hypothetical protein